MSELKKLIINGSEYTVTDDTKVPVPATAKVGQTLVVAAVDAEGRPTAWTAADSCGITLAQMDAIDDNDEIYVCASHTAQQLLDAVRGGKPVLAVLRNPAIDTVRTAFFFSDSPRRIVAGDALIDGGWQHCVGNQHYYHDGDTTNTVLHNELWVAY